MQAKEGERGEMARYLFDNRSFRRELFPSGSEIVAGGNCSNLSGINTQSG